MVTRSSHFWCVYVGDGLCSRLGFFSVVCLFLGCACAFPTNLICLYERLRPLGTMVGRLARVEGKLVHTCTCIDVM